MIGLGVFNIVAQLDMVAQTQHRVMQNIMVFLIKCIVQPDNLSDTKKMLIFLVTELTAITTSNTTPMLAVGGQMYLSKIKQLPVYITTHPTSQMHLLLPTYMDQETRVEHTAIAIFGDFLTAGLEV